MEKLSLYELGKRTDWQEAVIVFKEESFSKPFPEKSRSYKFKRSAKYFDPSMIGSSLPANCLDGTDDGVRIDWYMHDGEWIEDYCYIVK